jgi:site-specific recombinase XerD
MENYDLQIENQLKAIPAKYRKQAIAFDEQHIREGLAKTSRLRYLHFLHRFLEALDKPLDKVSLEDINSFITKMRRENCSDGSIHQQVVTLKKFFKLLGKAELAKGIKIPRRERRLPEDILTQDEVLALAKAAINPRDRALIMVLYDSGARIGELCYGLKIKNVVFDELGAKLLVDGKTGQRAIRLIYSVDDLRNWIEHHPKREDPEAPVFINNSTGKPIDIRSAARIIKGIAKRIGLKKKVNPHNFRHSRFSHLGNKLTDKELMLLAGWKTRAMVDVYTHLSMRDIENKLLAVEGIVKNEVKPVESPLAPRTCPRCRKPNSPSAKFCAMCGAALDLKAAMEMESKQTRELEELKAKVRELEEIKEVLAVLARGLKVDR